jgi:hypothetical protein
MYFCTNNILKYATSNVRLFIKLLSVMLLFSFVYVFEDNIFIKYINIYE